jgi:hypothetical protein
MSGVHLRFADYTTSIFRDVTRRLWRVEQQAQPFLEGIKTMLSVPGPVMIVLTSPPILFTIGPAFIRSPV